MIRLNLDDPLSILLLETKLEVEFNLKGVIKNKSDELASSSNNS